MTRNRRVGTVTGAVTLLVGLAAPQGLAVSGNIAPNAIEIEKAGKANLVAGTAAADVFNAGATKDWIADSTGNTGTNCLPAGIALCNQAGVTAATGGVGNWNGVRLVDGIDGSSEQDIFLNGGKENDTSSWNVGPGSVGSSKYDATQAYLANNQDDLFFGMERAGNNGTTAFDFEFNRNAPVSTYVPTRTTGDVLFTFEMQGSGGSGSVTPHFFRYGAGGYTEQALPAGTFSSINDNTTTAGEPWGHVDSHGHWVLGNLDRNTFAEAIVNLANVFPGFQVCGNNSAYVEIRTRSSSTDNSDLKDTTKIFAYEFNPPASPSTQLAATCTQTFTYNSPGSASSWDWDFVVSAAQATAGVTLSGTGVTGPTTAGNGDKVYGSTLQSGVVSVTLPAGVASASIEVSQTTTNAADCTAGDGPFTVTVYKVLGVSSTTLSSTCATPDVISYSATATGGNGTYNYAWTIQKNIGTVATPNWATAGTFTDGPTSGASTGTFDVDAFAVNKGDGFYRALVTVTDTQGLGCHFDATSNVIEAAHALGATASKTSADGSALSVLLTGSATNGGGSPTYQWQKLVGATWTDIATATSSTLTYSAFETDGTLSATTFTMGGDSYSGKLWTVQLRLHVTRSLNGVTCTADSPSVTVKKVTAVDP